MVFETDKLLKLILQPHLPRKLLLLLIMKSNQRKYLE